MNKRRSARILVVHPDGQYADVLSAMTAAVAELWKTHADDRWIAVEAGGMGESEDQIILKRVLLRGRAIDVGQQRVSLSSVLGVAGLPLSSARQVGSRIQLAPTLTAAQAARILDAVFRTQLGIRGSPDSQNDYSVEIRQM